MTIWEALLPVFVVSDSLIYSSEVSKVGYHYAGVVLLVVNLDAVLVILSDFVKEVLGVAMS